MRARGSPYDHAAYSQLIKVRVQSCELQGRARSTFSYYPPSTSEIQETVEPPTSSSRRGDLLTRFFVPALGTPIQRVRVIRSCGDRPAFYRICRD